MGIQQIGNILIKTKLLVIIGSFCGFLTGDSVMRLKGLLIIAPLKKTSTRSATIKISSSSEDEKTIHVSCAQY